MGWEVGVLEGGRKGKVGEGIGMIKEKGTERLRIKKGVKLMRD